MLLRYAFVDESEIICFLTPIIKRVEVFEKLLFIIQ